MAFNPETSHFTLEFVVNTSIRMPTEVFASQKYVYTNGYAVRSSPPGALRWQLSSVRENILEVYPTKVSKTGDTVRLDITPRDGTKILS